MMCVLCRSSCPTLCNPMDYSPPGSCSSVHGDFSGKNTGVGCHALLQGIFQTQELSPGLPHCKWILYHLSHQGSPQANDTCCTFDKRTVLFLFLFLFLPRCPACGILVPSQGSILRPLCWKHRVLTTGQPGKSL